MPDSDVTGNTNENANTNDNSSASTGNAGLTGKFIGSDALPHATRTHTRPGRARCTHGRAYETLEVGQETNAECVEADVVGFGQAGGWVDRALTNDLAGVGCESCHLLCAITSNAERRHAATDDRYRCAQVCGQCHTGEHHPNYDDWATSGHAAIEAGGGELLHRGHESKHMR